MISLCFNFLIFKYSVDKITNINLVLKDYFDLNKSVDRVVARDMMSYFVLAGIFEKDENA